jgi:prepilin-type N-terminal cleavage/methylation domain-containing protein
MRLKRRGFTLVEVMIVVGIMAVLLTIAVPNFLRARAVARQRTCLQNMRQIDNAKDQHAMENRLADGTACVMGDLVPGFMRNTPTCPTGGIYTVGVIGTKATCSHANTDPSHPHVSP